MEANLRSVPKAGKKYSQSIGSILKTNYHDGELLNFLFSLIRKIMASFLGKILMKLFGIRDNLNLSAILSSIPVHIIDVGAADGFDNRWNQIGENLNITLFEPEEEAHNKLIRQYKDDSRINCTNVALSENGEKLHLNVTAWTRASSVYEPDNEFNEKFYLRDHYQVIDKIEIKTKRLIDVCNQADFIKIDVQGYELPILRGADDLINSCIGLELEVSFNSSYKNTPSFSDVDSFCKKNGFSLVELRKPGYLHYLLSSTHLESKGLISDSDALYFRLPHDICELIYLKKWDINKLAIAASIYLAYGNYEFAYVLIEEAADKLLISRDDHLYQSIRDLVNLRSGHNKLISYRSIEKLKQFISGTRDYDTLGF